MCRETIEELPRNWKGSRLHDMEVFTLDRGLDGRRTIWFDMADRASSDVYCLVPTRQGMADRADYGGLWSVMIWQTCWVEL